jgi:hypothetical protein
MTTVRIGQVQATHDKQGEFVVITISGAHGLEKCANVYAKDSGEKLEDLLKAYDYFKGKKSHHSRAVRSLITRVQASE